MMRHLLAVALGVALSACTATPPAPAVQAQESRPDPLPGTKLSVDQLKAQMFHVSAGKRLKPKWPNGAKVAVGLSFDADNATAALSTGNIDYEILSRGEYGAVDGLPRILRLLDRHQLPSSFFIPAVAAILHPQMITDIQSAKQTHEIGVHGWIHERLPLLNNESEEQRLLNQSIETLTKMTGKRPVGYRAPSWKHSNWTMGQVKAAGFLYDSSLMASDDAYEILLDGKPTGVVELPIERILDDAPYFGSNADGSNPTIDDVFSVFQAEFDVAHDEGGLYLLTMHPHMMGHRSRIVLLERLVQYMKKKGGVWFATHEQIANHVKPLIAGS
jgi:peptidoglycan/xylan/chitin deacetylase (PgdA/CDA1 family)